MSDYEKEQLIQLMLQHKEQVQELFDSVQALSKNQNAQELLLRVIEILKERGDMYDSIGAELLEDFINAANHINDFTDGESSKQQKTVKITKNPHADFFISPIDKLSKAVLGCNPKFSMQEFFDDEATPVATGKKITVSAILRYEDMPEALQSKIANRRTRAVHDAIISLICEGYIAIRLQDIASALNGYKTDRKATDAFLKEIKQESDWLIHTWIKIDATNEAKARGYDFQEVHFDRPLIPAGGVGVINKHGQIVEGYEIWAEPALYAYAKQKKQVISVPVDMLALPDKLKLTFENIILRNYFIERIEGMSQGKMSNVITYNDIYKALEAQNSSREHKREIRERSKLMLNNWVELAYIESYIEESDEHKRPVKIVITPYLRKKQKMLKG